MELGPGLSCKCGGGYLRVLLGAINAELANALALVAPPFLPSCVAKSPVLSIQGDRSTVAVCIILAASRRPSGAADEGSEGGALRSQSSQKLAWLGPCGGIVTYSIKLVRYRFTGLVTRGHVLSLLPTIVVFVASVVAMALQR